MSKNVNSFAENMATLTENANKILELAQNMNEAVSGNVAEVKVNEDLTLPSFANVVKRVDRAENTIAKFTQGKGVIETDDGTYRTIKVSTISTPPTKITGVEDVSTFNTNANWFFESLQWPRCNVSIDLKDKIDDDSDRAFVNRVIIDTKKMESPETLLEDLQSAKYDYGSLVKYLSEKGIGYYEDKDEVKLPLTYEKYYGKFTILSTSLIKNVNGVSKQWYYLDSINYALVDDNGIEQNDGYILSTGDYLRYRNSLYKIIEIDQPEKRVRLDYAVGYETLGVADEIEFYNAPFADKIINVGIGINEINILYIKGVNENYNLMGREWSEPIIFYTNNLVFEENNNVPFSRYYSEMVVDFGQEWIADAMEGKKHAYNGLIPNKPVLNADDLRVVQINTQLNATLDTETYNNLTSEIASTKSNINAIRSAIANNKERLLQSTSSDIMEGIQNTINADTEKLNNMTTQFSSLVDELNTLLTETGVISYTPKYHVRGFFAIPAPKYGIGDDMDKQSIIGFETMYRYLHTDETGVELSTFEYTSNVGDSSVVKSTGVFTDWNLSVSPFLEKHQDNETGLFVWSDELIDGTHVNINAIDIPIRSGEKVEIKVRSISECGYPYNPLKSDWSNSVIIEFPDTLTTNDSVSKILDNVRDDMTSVVLQETLSSAGMYSHIADSNSIYKHSAENIQFIERTEDENGKTTVSAMSLYDKIVEMSNMIESLIDNSATTTIDYHIGETVVKRVIPRNASSDSSEGELRDAIDKKIRSEFDTPTNTDPSTNRIYE